MLDNTIIIIDNYFRNDYKNYIISKDPIRLKECKKYHKYHIICKKLGVLIINLDEAVKSHYWGNNVNIEYADPEFFEKIENTLKI